MKLSEMKGLKGFKLTNGNAGYLIEMINQLPKESPWRVTVEPWKEKRGLTANALQHVWYSQISKETGETIDNVAARCKLEYGLPILLASGTESAIALDSMLDSCQFWARPYESQIAFVKVIQVTSLMDTKEHAAFLEQVQFAHATMGITLKNEKDNGE